MDSLTILYIRIKIRYMCKRLSTVDQNIRHISKKVPIYLMPKNKSPMY